MEKEINNEKLNDEYEKKCFELAHYIFPDVDETRKKYCMWSRYNI